MGNKLYLIKEIDISELDWRRAVSILERRRDIHQRGHFASFRGAHKWPLKIVARSLRESLRGPLSLRWYRSTQLSSAEGELCKALCETQGADELIISSRYPFELLGMNIIQEVQLAPFSKGDEGTRIKSFRKLLEIKGNQAPLVLSWYTVLGLNLVMVLLGVALSVVSLGLLLWGLAVFIVFVRSPLGMTASAINRIDLWIALLGVLSGISSIIGSLLRRIHGKIRTGYRE